MPHRTLGSHAPGVRIIAMHNTMPHHAEDPPFGSWNLHLYDDGNQHKLTMTAETADDFGDFIARLTHSP
ncbi:hypothetical protein AB0F17_07210 [Nonomuraea sp. NPDC026600]|uniref:hypothetical protein n=1 Tax=Nonomuraea sp. NPDC026600 TaxID=3155363 RepID=UPI003407B7B5